MSFPLKIFLSLCGLVLTTIVGAAIYLTVIFDPNDYRDEIAAAVEEQTGRKLTLAGDIDLNLFPWVGATIAEVALANARNFGPEPMLEVGLLEARMEIMPLIFERAVRVGEIRLENLVVRVAQKGDSNNWDDIAAHQAARNAAQDAESGETEPTAAPDEDDVTVVVSNGDSEGFDLAVAGVTLKNIRVESRTDDDLTVVQLDSLRTGPIRLGDISDLQIEMSAELPDARSLTLTLDTQWRVQPKPLLAQLENLRLDATIAGTGIPGGKQRILATGGASFDGESQKAVVPGLTVTAGDLSATIKASMDLAGAKGPQGTVELRTNEFIAQKLAGELGIPLGNPATAKSSQFDIALAIAADSLRTTRLDATLDGAKLGGNLAVENFSAPRIRGKLDLAAFTLESWTPPASETTASDDQPDATETPLPLDVVKDMDLDLTARIGEFQGSGIKARDVIWTAWSRPGQPFRQELTMKAYGGQITARNEIDARGKQPKTGLKLNLEAVGLGDLLKGTIGESYVSGLTQLSLNLDTQGNTIKNMLKAAVGEASYSLKDGSVAGLSLLDVINSAAAKIDGSSTKANDGSTPTKFTELAGKWLFSGGKASAQTLKADSELVSLGGTGGINLDTLTWDMNLLPRLKDHPKIREQRVLSKLIGTDLPLRIKGPLMSPSLSLDIEDALKARAKQEIDAKKDELKAKADAKVAEEKARLKEKANEEIGRQLDKLFGKKNAAPTPTPATAPATTPSSTPAP